MYTRLHLYITNVCISYMTPSPAPGGGPADLHTYMYTYLHIYIKKVCISYLSTFLSSIYLSIYLSLCLYLYLSISLHPLPSFRWWSSLTRGERGRLALAAPRYTYIYTYTHPCIHTNT